MNALSFSKLAVFLLAVFSLNTLSAQEDDEENTIDTERLIIVKPYSPTVSDAFKVKQMPKLTDSLQQQPKEVNYKIFSFPVASTFTPAKGKASGVQIKPRPRLYDNYAALGFGNYSNAMAEFYSTVELNRDEKVNLALQHNSSQGGIENAVLDDKYYDTQLDVDYQAQARTFSWGANFGVQHQVYNWYGAPDFLPLTPAEYEDIDPQHTFYAVAAGANINMDQGVFNKADLQYRRFGDNYSSGENHVVLTPEFEFYAGNEIVNTELSVDYLGGKFDRNYFTEEELNYSYLNLGILPSIQLTQGDLNVELGAQLVYSIDSENDDNDFFIYPKVKASYPIAGDYLSLYAGAEGGLKQNTYYAFAQENPFVSPTLAIAPTDKQYDIYAGVKGKFTSALSYNAKASYTSEKNKALFMHNPYQPANSQENYQNFNSFGVVYDDVTTLGVYGELQYQANEKLNLRLSAEAKTYDTDKREEAWNLPEVKASFTADYQISEKWFANASIFYVGERKDRHDFSQAAVDGLSRLFTRDLGAYLDANLKLGYNLNNQLSFFVMGNNLAEGNYQRWMGYSVQDIQFMGGASYQFDW